MARDRKRALKLALVLASLGVCASAQAQMSKGTLETLSFSPPAHPFNIQHSFTAAGPYLQTLQNYAVGATDNNGGEDPKNVVYAQYISPASTSLYITAAFADPIPPPGTSSTGTTDACHHAHLEYAVYRYGIRYLNFGARIPILSTELVSSTGELGRRVDANGRQVNDGTAGATCLVTSAPDTIYPSFNGTFDWGATGQWVSMAATSNFTPFTVLVAVQAASHGWGSCGHFLCFPGVTLMAFRSG